MKKNFDCDHFKPDHSSKPAIATVSSLFACCKGCELIIITFYSIRKVSVYLVSVCSNTCSDIKVTVTLILVKKCFYLKNN